MLFTKLYKFLVQNKLGKVWKIFVLWNFSHLTKDCEIYFTYCEILKAKNDPELAPMVVQVEAGQPGVNSPLLRDGPDQTISMNKLLKANLVFDLICFITYSSQSKWIGYCWLW